MSDSSQSNARERVVKSAFQCRAALEAYAFALLGDYVEAQDVVQDAFLVVIDRWEVFEEGSSMIAWTRAIVRRKVLQYLDQRKRRSNLQDRLLSDALDSAFEQVQDQRREEKMVEQGQILKKCLSQLTERSRDLLRLIYLEKKSYEAASEEVSMGVEGVRKALYRAKNQLRSCAAKQTGGVS